MISHLCDDDDDDGLVTCGPLFSVFRLVDVSVFPGSPHFDCVGLCASLVYFDLVFGFAFYISNTRSIV